METALRQAASPDVEGEPARSASQRRADALVDMCRWFLDHQGQAVPAALWAALVLRDQHAASRAVTARPEWCEAHHIIHWSEGGDTSLWNSLLGCNRHHHLLHQPGWQVKLSRFVPVTPALPSREPQTFVETSVIR